MRYGGIIKFLLITTALGIGIYYVVGVGKRKRIRNINEFVGFDPNYWQNHSVTISPTYAKVLADNAKDAVGFFNDDESTLLSVLREAGSKANLSKVSYYYTIRHGGSLAQLYASYMDGREETKQIIDILETLK